MSSTNNISLDEDMEVIEYSDGVLIKSLIVEGTIPETPQPTIEEQILTENQYQTALLEMNMIGGI